jgi:hypothetical protein
MDISTQDSLYLTISSSKSDNNKGTSAFTTILYKTFKFNNELYEVGLIDFIYRPCRKLFLDCGDYHANVIYPKEVGTTLSVIKSESGSLEVDVSNFNFTMMSVGIPFLLVRINKGSKINYEIQSSFTTQCEIGLSAEAQKIFGFSSSRYPNGTTKPDREMNTKIYDELKPGESVSFFKIETVSHSEIIKFENPFESSIEGLVTEINTKFSFSNVPVVLSTTLTGILIEIETKGVEITFSTRLRKIMGINVETLSGSSHDLDSIDLYAGNHLFIVECDLIAPQVTDTFCTQTLRTFLQSKEEAPVVHTQFDRPQFSPLQKCEFSTISLRVYNESLESIDFDPSVGVTCVIQIKLKSNV